MTSFEKGGIGEVFKGELRGYLTDLSKSGELNLDQTEITAGTRYAILNLKFTSKIPNTNEKVLKILEKMDMTASGFFGKVKVAGIFVNHEDGLTVTGREYDFKSKQEE